MEINELLQKLVIDEEESPKSDDKVLQTLLGKELARLGLEIADKYELTNEQLSQLTDHFYEMGFEDGVNEAE